MHNQRLSPRQVSLLSPATYPQTKDLTLCQVYKLDHFEIKPTGRKETGLGAFATCFIKAGTFVTTEKPMMIMNKPRMLITPTDIMVAYKQLELRD